MEENKETEEQRSEVEERRERERRPRRERDLYYITACAVRTFVEEFGRRLRSP